MSEKFMIREQSQPWDDDAMIVLWDLDKGQWLQYYAFMGWPNIKTDKPLSGPLTHRACEAIHKEFDESVEKPPIIFGIFALFVQSSS